MAIEDPSSGLAPAQRSKIRRLSAPREVEPGEEGGELNVVPYLDIIMNVMMFMLAAVSVVFVSTVQTNGASASPSPFAEPPPALRLTAIVTRDGIALIAGGSHIATGCEGAGSGVTIPKRDGAHDLSALTECARKIKGSRTEYQDEYNVTLTASSDIEYADLVSAMDALRSDPAGPLFPKVTFGVAR